MGVGWIHCKCGANVGFYPASCPMITINKLLPCVHRENPKHCPVMEMEHQGCVWMHVHAYVHMCISLAGCSWPLGSWGGCSFAPLLTVFPSVALWCVTLTTGTLLEDKNISSLPLAQVCASEVETDFSKQVASNERHTLSIRELAIERGQKTSGISTVWRWEASKRTNYHPQTVAPPKKTRTHTHIHSFCLSHTHTHKEINKDTNWTISCN